MISILIPSYNCPVADLVATLHRQCGCLPAFEIIVADDGSTEPREHEYAAISLLDGVRVLRQRDNLGRARIRNLLADTARYPFLLFIDGDAMGVSEDFIARYMQAAGRSQAICGGTVYLPVRPASRQLYLRWKYGRCREMRTLTDRQRDPWRSFSSFNFLISREAFMSLRFDTSLRQYGHEDTLFGIGLRRLSICPEHIDAPMLHTGLDTNAEFLEKSLLAVRNLWMLYTQPNLRRDLAQGSSLLAAFRLLETLRLTKAAALLFRLLDPAMRRLICKYDSLALLDLYKLGAFCHEAMKRPG